MDPPTDNETGRRCVLRCVQSSFGYRDAPTGRLRRGAVTGRRERGDEGSGTAVAHPGACQIAGPGSGFSEVPVLGCEPADPRAASCAQGARELDRDALSYALGMGGLNLIDTRFDVRTDAGGKDPDSHSKTLRRYHQLLWSKPLPGGDIFDLDAKLHHKSDLGDFWLSSDSITPTYSAWGRPARLVGVVGQVSPMEMKAFYDLACTVGAYLVFPLPVQVDGNWKQSINQRRGIHGRICDRFDLTLECIRRHYRGGTSPLADNLVWYDAFFDLFGDFPGYVDHFLLNDLVDVDYASVNFLKAFDDFAGDPLPAANVAEYQQYMSRSMDFISARNERIAHFASSEVHDRT